MYFALFYLLIEYEAPAWGSQLSTLSNFSFLVCKMGAQTELGPWVVLQMVHRNGWHMEALHQGANWLPPGWLWGETTSWDHKVPTGPQDRLQSSPLRPQAGSMWCLPCSPLLAFWLTITQQAGVHQIWNPSSLVWAIGRSGFHSAGNFNDTI